MFGDVDAGDIRLHRLEFAANFRRGVGLEVVHLHVRRPARQPDEDDGVIGGRIAGTGGSRLPHGVMPAAQPGARPPSFRKLRRETGPGQAGFTWAPMHAGGWGSTATARRFAGLEHIILPEAIVARNSSFVGRTFQPDGCGSIYSRAAKSTIMVSASSTIGYRGEHERSRISSSHRSCPVGMDTFAGRMRRRTSRSSARSWSALLAIASRHDPRRRQGLRIGAAGVAETTHLEGVCRSRDRRPISSHRNQFQDPHRESAKGSMR